MTGPGGASIRTGRMHHQFSAPHTRSDSEREKRANDLDATAAKWEEYAKGMDETGARVVAAQARDGAATLREMARELREAIAGTIGVVSEEPGDLPE